MKTTILQSEKTVMASVILVLTVAVLIAVPSLESQTQVHALPSDNLETQFKKLPATARPWVWWMWFSVEGEKAAITKDLEEMHAKGIEGAILFQTSAGEGKLEASSRMVLGDKGFVRVPTKDFAGATTSRLVQPPMPAWSPEARERIRFAVREAARIGIKLGVTVGLADTGGEIAPEYGQQRLVWSEVDVNGSQEVNQQLPEPLLIYRTPNRSSTGFNALETAPKPGEYTPKEIAVLAVPDKESFDPSEVVDLSGMAEGGHVRWTTPPGRWRILRFAYEPTGKRSPWGLFTDALSADALDATWKVTMGKLLEEMLPAERREICCVLDDSWEAGQTTWTKLLPFEFNQLRGYDLIKWLPALADQPEGTEAQRNGVKRDFSRTVADLIARNHYAHLRELAHEAGMVAFAEAAGPNTVQLDPIYDGMGLDVPTGEFWMPSEHRPTLDVRFLLRDSVGSSHIYGKRVTACESFTEGGPQWEESFFDMKSAADQAFSDGCNMIFFHAYSQSPSLTAKPGYVYWAGTHYDRNVTWWNETPAFNDYLGRISLLLQQGLFVADSLYYRGDGIGQLEQRKHDPALPAPGYDHDNVDLHGLMDRVDVENGRLVLPDGMSYRMLVLPEQESIDLGALRKIKSLVEKGAVVVGPRPIGTSGLVLRRSDQDEFDKIVSCLWPEASNTECEKTVRQAAPESVLQQLNLPPDFQFSGLSNKGQIDWIHRRLGETEIYFISSRWDPMEKISATFRVTGMQPELWDPVRGTIRDATSFRQEGGRTTIPLELNPRGSVFVVFRRKIPTTINGIAASNYPKVRPLQQIEGQWKVYFDSHLGGPGEVNFDSLIDWTKRPEDGIRYYSGDATYRTTFDVEEIRKGEGVDLDLGEVHDVARVRLNGIELGIVWTKPASIDVTRAVHKGQNQLEVTVTNLWPNRLIGDAGLPAAQRITVTNVQKFNANTPLYPSGLIGPVRLEAVEY